MGRLDTDARITWRDAAHRDPDEIEHDIDDTRAEVHATLDALERKLSPDRLLDMTLGRVRQHGGEFAGNLGHTVKENPLPLLLTSLGVAWMMLSNRGNGNGYANRAESGNGSSRWRERLHRAQERWTGAKEGAREHLEGAREHMTDMKESLYGAGESAREHLSESRATVSEAASSLRDGARRASDATRAQMRRARSGADYLMQEQPLLLGAIGLVAGALIGAVLPATREEDRLLGDTRDRTLERAKRAGRQGYRRVRDRAEDMAEQAAEKLRGDGGDRDSARNEQQMADREWPTDDGGRTAQSTMSTSAGTDSTRSARPDGMWADEAERRNERRSDEVPNFGENPTEPRDTKRRASERGVGREHASDSFSTPDSSPTSKTPPF